MAAAPLSHAPTAATGPTTVELAAARSAAVELHRSSTAELEHVRSELEKVETRLTDARGTVESIEAERTALLERSERLTNMLHHLSALSSGAGEAAPVPAMASSSSFFGRELRRPGQTRTLALWHAACLRHMPHPSCIEQPMRLRSVVGVLEELAAAHPSLLALISSTTKEVAAKYVAPLVHKLEYIKMLESSTPRSWEPPTRLVSAANGEEAEAAARASLASGLQWSADGERRSAREGKGQHLPALLLGERLGNGGGGGLSTTAVAPIVQAAAASSAAAAEAAALVAAGVDLDTFLSCESLSAARHASGAVCAAIDHVMRGTCRNAFVAARPPGHHAGKGGLAPTHRHKATAY